MSSRVVDKVCIDILFKVMFDEFVSEDIRYDVTRKVSDFDTTMNIMINAVTGELSDSEISGLIYKTSRQNQTKIIVDRFGPSTYTDLAMETWDKIDEITFDIRHQILDELEELHDFT